MERSRRCESCKIDLHRAPYAKQFKSKKHLESMKEDKTIVPEQFYLEEIKCLGENLKRSINLKY